MKHGRTIVLLAGLVSSMAAGAVDLPKVDVYKSANCGCCNRWADHLRQQGFAVTMHVVADVAAERKRLGMPEAVASCHTAKIGNYVVEGHVPASDIKRMLAEKTKALGLAVPDMREGSPGMEGPHPVPYEVLLVQTNGALRPFANH